MYKEKGVPGFTDRMKEAIFLRGENKAKTPFTLIERAFAKSLGLAKGCIWRHTLGPIGI
jgi:hypothetical protein